MTFFLRTCITLTTRNWMINAIFSDEANSCSIMGKFLEGFCPISPGACFYNIWRDSQKKRIEIVGLSG